MQQLEVSWQHNLNFYPQCVTSCTQVLIFKLNLKEKAIKIYRLSVTNEKINIYYDKFILHILLINKNIVINIFIRYKYNHRIYKYCLAKI